MYIVAIAWLYVVLMMAVTERSVVGAVLTFLFYGLFPLALFLWVFGGPARSRARARAREKRATSVASESAEPSVSQPVNEPDRGNPKAD